MERLHIGVTCGKTVQWYLDNLEWYQLVQEGAIKANVWVSLISKI